MPRTAWYTFALSNLSFVIGILQLAAGINALKTGKDASGLISGPMIIFGALACQSAKKRSLGLKQTTRGRRVYEIILLIIIVLLVVGQKNVLQVIYIDPVPFLIVPLWILIAYVCALYIKPKQLPPVNHAP